MDDESKTISLLQAAKDNDTKRCKELLDDGADASLAVDEEGMTCLMAAAEHGNADLVSLLLQAGAPWMAQDNEGYTAGMNMRLITHWCV